MNYQVNGQRSVVGSKLAKSHKELKHEVEEALRAGATSLRSKSDLQGGSYSLRAIPQIYQPVIAVYQLFQQHVNTEINAIDDNPLLLPDEHEELHGANFHGHPISVTADSLNVAAITLANAANARVDRLLKSHHSDLPAFLATGKEGLYLLTFAH